MKSFGENGNVANLAKTDQSAEATVREVIEEMAELPKLQKPDQSSATHASDFAVVVQVDRGERVLSKTKKISF